MFENSTLLALAKNDSKFCVYKIQVKKEALLAIQSNFKQGIDYFSKLDPHPFTGTYKLDEEECLKIDNYSLSQSLSDAIINSANLAPITGDQFKDKNIKALFMGTYLANQDTNLIIAVFKRLYFSNCLTKGGLNLFFDKNSYNTISTNIISVPENYHILLKGGTLYFSSYKIASEILNLTDYYRQSTESDLENFANHISFESNNDSLTDFANTRIRRLIALINDSHVLEKFSNKELADEASKQNLSLSFVENKIKLNLDDKKETLLILDFLAENTFMSTFTKQRNRTNSKERI